MKVDLNCDVGEGAGQDAALMPLITSANIACGGHAGDLETMRAAVDLARRHGVAVGAHPGFEDREHFGRREWVLSEEEIVQLVRRQIEALRAITPLTHVKPHGALYNLAARDRRVADAIAAAVAAIDPRLVLVGLARSCLIEAATAWGLRGVSEVFADRSYQPDGSLTPRTEERALIDDADAAAAQVLQMLREGRVQAVDGSFVPLRADTVCLHGDGPHALELARRLRSELADAGVEVRPFVRT
jgi:5-oxoprolinase (ATP-hydrolysing) subunit A